MDSERLDHIQHLFHAALEQPPEARAAFLDQACGDDPDLRAAVERYLDADDEGFALLDEPLAQVKNLDLPTEPLPSFVGRQVGQYRILKQLGRGGMGSVFLAQRDDQQFKGLAAIKLIRRGMDTDDILRRFRNERQILAALTHAGIARLLDGGMTEEGLPYFVMDYIDGAPIDQYCDTHRLSIAARLDLFVAVCEAVQYAHQNLVVHRDLKPTNILVTDAGQVKLLDFGIAKVLNPVLSSASMMVTRTGFRVMTPAYASPEQIRGETITTASDVYALGILLYALLTGHQPHPPANRLEPEQVRIALDVEPVKPSTAVTQTREIPDRDGASSTITPAQVSAARSTEIDQLKRRLRGDLDTIVMKALRKEPAQRYASAEQLSADVQRFLAGVPILARKATTGYRVRKFVLRHRVGVVAATLALLSLMGGLGAAVWQARVAAQERDLARQEAAKLAEVTAFVVSVFEIADPSESLGETITARELLDRGRQRIETELSEVPEVQATMMDVMGQVYQSLGLKASANPLIERALAQRQALFVDDHPDVATSLDHVATIRLSERNFEAADSLFRAALAMRSRLYQGDHPDIAESLHGLGLALRFQGAWDEAEQRLRQALAMRRRLYGQDHAAVATSLHTLGQFMHDKPGQGAVDYDKEALQHYREALAIRRKVLDEQHPDLSTSIATLAFMLNQQGRFEEAEALYRESVSIARAVYGNDGHTRVSGMLNNFGLMLWNSGAYEAAEPLFREALALNQRLRGPEDALVGMNLSNLGSLLRDTGKFDEADSLLRQSLRLRRTILGEDHMLVGWVMNNLGLLYHHRGQDAQADSLLRAALSLIETHYTRPSSAIAITQGRLAQVLHRQGRLDEAEAYLRTSLATQRAEWGPAHHYSAESRYQLAAVLLAQGDLAAAAAHADTALNTLRTLYPEGHIKTAAALLTLGQIRLHQDRAQEASAFVEEALLLRQRFLPEQHWQLAQAQSYLGACRLAQARHDEAKKLLQASYTLFKETLGERHPETQRVRQQLALAQP